jgi:hypothetical protein
MCSSKEFLKIILKDYLEQGTMSSSYKVTNAKKSKACGTPRVLSMSLAIGQKILGTGCSMRSSKFVPLFQRTLSSV